MAEPEEEATSHLRFAPEILARLGEELVPHPDLGIIELVRNAYDADADRCDIFLKDVGQRGGSVEITDNGLGMTRDAILRDWLLLGSSQKRAQRHSGRRHRRMVGEKGLGRLAALRLGARVILRTRPEDEPDMEHLLTINWHDFALAESVEEVSLTVYTRHSSEKRGTTIELHDLRGPLSRQDVTRLARSLVLLSDPWEDNPTFRAELHTDEFTELEALVRRGYFNEADYRLDAVLEDGVAKASMVDWTGEVVAESGHGRIARERHARIYAAPNTTFQLWVFLLSRPSFDARHSTQAVDAVRKWLRTVGGVHLYHRDLRVHPYGDAGFDWLDMNVRRTGSPEGRPSTNTSIGRVIVLDDTDALIAKTDRSGLIENPAFEELRAFAGDVLEWAADERVRIRDELNAFVRRRTVDRLVTAEKAVADAVNELPLPARTEVRSAITAYERAVEERLLSLDEDLQLYRTLGTVGTTTSVFAHEALRPIDTIEVMADAIAIAGRKALGQKYEELLGDAVSVLTSSSASLRTFADLPLRLLERSKRRPSRVNVNRSVTEVVALFRPFMGEAHITVETELGDVRFFVNGSVAALEAILANLLVNAAYVLVNESTSEERMVSVATSVNPPFGTIRVFDNGPGIRGIDLDEVWLPGRTTRRGGTGLGLTIVRDVVNSLGGRVEATPKGELGGAEFIVELPLAREVS